MTHLAYINKNPISISLNVIEIHLWVNLFYDIAIELLKMAIKETEYSKIT